MPLTMNDFKSSVVEEGLNFLTEVKVQTQEQCIEMNVKESDYLLRS